MTETILAAPWHGTPGPDRADRERRRIAFDAARRHSRRVRRLRLVLPALGFVLVAGLAAATHFALPEDIDLSVARLSVTRNSIIMDKPHLTGFDSDAREYSVSADRAIQALTSPDQVRLETIRATVSVKEQGTATITAEAGDYDNTKSTLQLYGGIAVDSSEGYALRMSDAAIDLRAGTMASSGPVTVSYQDSTTAGRYLSVTGGGKSIVLEGGVRTTLMPPKRASQAAAPAGEQQQ